MGRNMFLGQRLKIIPLKYKIGLVLVLGFVLLTGSSLYISLAKLSAIYRETFKNNLEEKLTSARFVLKSFENDLDQSAMRIVNNRSFLDTFKEEDPDLQAVSLENLMSLEPLHLSYVVWLGSGDQSLDTDRQPNLFKWTRGHNLKSLSQDHKQAFQSLIWQRLLAERSDVSMEGPFLFRGYWPLPADYVNQALPNENFGEDQLVYFVGIPIKIWQQTRGVAIFGCLLDLSSVLKTRLRRILHISTDDTMALQIQSGGSSYLRVGAEAFLQKLVADDGYPDFEHVAEKLEPSGTTITLTSDRGRLTREINQAIVIISSVFVGLLFVFLVISLLFLAKVLNRFDDLVKTANLMKQGVYSARMPIKNNDEIGVLATRFNEMAQSIQDKVEQIAEQSRREKELRKLQHDAELSHLKSQMKPHFLFNSLHMIATLIDLDQAAAADTTQLLADLYRLILQSSKSPTPPLATEMEIVEKYLEIQKMRFGDRLKYSIEIEDFQKPIYVPQLILQTLVENAVKHGIEKTIRGGEIVVKIVRKSAHVFQATVSNSGEMSLERYRERTGIRNTRLMLKHLYGPQGTLSFFDDAPGVVTVGFTFTGEKL
jgi:HAMP domain-containing protein